MASAALLELDELMGHGPSNSPAPDVGVSVGAGEVSAMVGYDGADRTEKLISWAPALRSADQDILQDKPTLDARAHDMLRNDGFVAAGSSLHKDHIVGELFLLNAKPRTKLLRGKEDEVWEAEFQAEVEDLFLLWAESDRAWPDAGRRNTLTEMVRLAVGEFTAQGEVLAITEWMPDDGRPFQTAVLQIDPQRLANPSFIREPQIRAGVERDRRGAPIAYHILNRHPRDLMSVGIIPVETKRVMAFKPSGRRQVFHVFEQMRPDQTRGIAAIVSVLSEMRMLQKFRRVELERATASAMYGVTVETASLPGEAYAMLGGDATNPMMEAVAQQLSLLTQYSNGAKNLNVDGARIPFLPPGSKLVLQNPGNASPVGADLESSFMRHLAAAFGVSYEQFSRDFSKSNYSSARAAIGETLLHLSSLKRRVADKFASYVYRLWFEEAINRGLITTVRGPNMPSFYEGMNADAYCDCEWIGAGQGQIDQLKETQAAMLRIRGGLSTFETETARLGGDWRQVVKQRAREHAAIKATGLPSPYEAEPTDAENAATGEPREASE